MFDPVTYLFICEEALKSVEAPSYYFSCNHVAWKAEEEKEGDSAR